MAFQSHCDLRVLDESGFFELIALLVYRVSEKTLITVPIGFITDLASIPRLCRLFLDVNGKHRKAAVLHDFLYTHQLWPRLECDKVFMQAMIDCGVSRWRREIIYRGVRAGGWYRWNKARKAM